MNYWILTTQLEGNFSSNTIFYFGNLSMFLLTEREQGRQTNIVFAKEITSDEYDHVMPKYSYLKHSLRNGSTDQSISESNVSVANMLDELNKVVVTYRELSSLFEETGDKRRAIIYENEMFRIKKLINTESK